MVSIVVSTLDKHTDRNDGFLEALRLLANSNSDIRVLILNCPEQDVKNAIQTENFASRSMQQRPGQDSKWIGL
ncbi:hypothetical protein K504DRAFT_458947 [Pleomassaria siparia CBS 279.74]|uniref:Uncharacterized protein n=1 Tax=Pleomassaria siparia CBS 279.74 TaxID=1314801 RepID=A0A6G1K1D8_9PLEO|nr:hypothetical protein K504DRAFT_458947 [Pleomassaria siparia CBS 279.74]